MKNYHFYTARDFALDEDFQNWVLHPDIKNTHFWKSWLQEHSANAAIINEAIMLVRSVNYRSYSLSNEDKQKLWESVKDSINDVETEIAPDEIKLSKKRRNRYNKWRLLIAAVFTGIVVASVSWFNKDHSPLSDMSFSARTDFGEVKKLILPDSSEVTLNANSRLVYSEKNSNEREVWMEGEAYFHVKHTLDNKKFIVHTFDELSVEVLGTSFNVNNRGDQIAVVLQHGSIKLEIAEASNNTKTQLYLKPGEMISYNKKKGDYIKKAVDTDGVDSWANGRLKMNDYSLEDAVSFIQQTFGKNVITHDRNLLARKISGSMPIVYSLDTMLIQFAKAFNVHFHKNGDNISIEK